jgi:hypothetical protein
MGETKRKPMYRRLRASERLVCTTVVFVPPCPLAMNAKNFELAEGLVKHTYIQQAAQGRRQRENLTKVLLAEVYHT